MRGKGHNGNLTFIEEFLDGATQRDTELYYDWRDRHEKTVNPLPPHEFIVYDNLDRVTDRALFTAEPTAIDVPLKSGADYRGLYTRISYSQRGLVYKQRVAIDSTQSSPSYLETHTWFDEVGRPVGRWGPNSPMQKTTYDGLGRPVTVYLTDRHDDAAPGSSGNFEDVYDTATHTAQVDGDVVFEQTAYRYIADEGLLDLVTHRQRTHDADDSKTGDLADFVSPDNDLVITSFTGTYYDAADRVIRSAQYGTNQGFFQFGGSAPTINQQSPPSWSSSPQLVTETTYNSRGLVLRTTDPTGQITEYIYDAANRRIAVIENVDVSDPISISWDTTNDEWAVAGLTTTGPETNRTTTFVYNGVGDVTKQIAYKQTGPTTTQHQVTVYEYGVTTTGTLPSALKSNDLLRKITYPDQVSGGGAGVGAEITHAYNRLGELIDMTDENVSAHNYDRDDLGRVTVDHVASTGGSSGVDLTINAITTSYDTLGRIDTVRSHSGFTNPGSPGTTKNAVAFAYTTLWEIDYVDQDHDGEIELSHGVPTNNTVRVNNTYDTQAIGSGNYSRLVTLTYPDGADLDYSYGSAGSSHDKISRVIGYDLDSNTVAEWAYVGLDLPAITTYDDGELLLDRTAAHNGTHTQGVYPELDRFGRIINHKWIDDGFTTGPNSRVPNIPPIVELTYTYDKASNRLSSRDQRPGNAQPLSHEYDYDGLHRLVEAKRGVWVTNGIPTQAKLSEQWKLDALGNWQFNYIDANGDGTYAVSEREGREHDIANELLSRDPDVTDMTAPKDLTHDAAGNLKEEEFTTKLGSNQYTHDAWDRLVAIDYDNTSTVVPLGEYEYNGLNWRTVKRSETGTGIGAGQLDQERVMYYSPSWQLLEERIALDYSISSAIDRVQQYVWGVRYIDDIVLHRQDNNADGDYTDTSSPADETFYHLTDAQFSTVALVDDDQNVVERITYSAYGRARHHWPPDVDGDGDVDATDTGIINTIAGGSENLIGEDDYRAEADLDRDGDVDSADETIATNFGATSALDYGVLSDIGNPSGPGVDNTIGFDGYLFNVEAELYTVRFRWYSPELGRWLERDPAGYVDGMSLYEIVRSRPVIARDASGLMSSMCVVGGALAAKAIFRKMTEMRGIPSGIGVRTGSSSDLLQFLRSFNANDMERGTGGCYPGDEDVVRVNISLRGGYFRRRYRTGVEAPDLTEFADLCAQASWILWQLPGKGQGVPFPGLPISGDLPSNWDRDTSLWLQMWRIHLITVSVYKCEKDCAGFWRYVPSVEDSQQFLYIEDLTIPFREDEYVWHTEDGSILKKGWLCQDVLNEHERLCNIIAKDTLGTSNVKELPVEHDCCPKDAPK